MREADFQSKYRLPNMLSRNKAKEKVCNKIRSWANRTLSKVGQEVLIKSVAQSLPAYSMSIFLLPQEVLRDIEKALSRYWWNSPVDGKNKIHWLNWDKLSQHKFMGGMEFRNFRDFNLAMLG